MSATTVPKFIHIAAAGSAGNLWGLDVEGRVWEWVGYGWSRLPDAVAVHDQFHDADKPPED